MSSQLNTMQSSYDGKCISIITGASRGFGRSIAQLICNKDGILGNADAGSKIILMSRDYSELEKTKRLVENETGKFDVSIVQVDLSNIHLTKEVINKTLNDCGKDFNYAFLFNNAATLGDPRKLIPDYDDIEEIQNIFNLNVITSTFLISKFCKHFEGIKRFIIHTSTLAAVQPFQYTGFYSSSKACMDMFIQNIAADCPDVRTLNYAPGIMDTKMGRDLMDQSGNEETRLFLTKLLNEGKMINPIDSVKKLMLLLRKNEFVNGSHIDFFDVQ